MHPSGPHPPIWFLVFPLVLWCRSFRLKPFLESFLLPFLLCNLPILIFWFSCPSQCLAHCINSKIHWSIWDASVPRLVLCHIFFAIFSFQMCLASALLFVLVSRPHFHSHCQYLHVFGLVGTATFDSSTRKPESEGANAHHHHLQDTNSEDL